MTKRILSILLTITILFALAPLAAFAEETMVKNIFDDKGNGVTIASWGVESDTVIDKAFKKEGEASMKISYKGNSNQSTSALYFNGKLKVDSDTRKNGVLQFWYYSETDMPQVTISLTSPLGEGGKQAENRVTLKDKYVFAGDAGQWVLVQIPMSEFKDKGQYWNGSAFEEADFNWETVDKMLILGNTKGVETVKPVYIDSMAILTGVEIIEREAPSGAEYYVSPNGNDTNDGKSPERPFKTAQKAADKTLPGDTVYIMGGTYELNSGLFLNIKRSGEDGKVITYKNYKDEKPVIKAGGNIWNVISITASYITIDGLTLVGINDEIKLEEGWDSYYAVLNKQDTGADYDNAAVARTNTNCISFSGRELVDQGKGPLRNITIRNCDVSNFPACGIGGSGVDYLLVENNVVHGNMWYSLWGSSGISVLAQVDCDDNTEDYKCIIRNNILYDNKNLVKCQNGRKWSDGNGIIIDYNKNTGHEMRPPYKGKTLIENNLVYCNGGGGIHLFNSSNIDVVNNTTFDNGQASYANGLVDYDKLGSPDLTDWGNINVSWCTNVKVMNNIAVANRVDTSTLGYGDKNTKVIFANNIHYNYANPENDPAKNASNVVPEEFSYNNIWADPMFVDVANYDFHLKEGSPAIDFGTKTMYAETDFEGAKRPQGAQYDVGAYETAFTSPNPALNNDVDVEALMGKEEEFPVEFAQCAKGRPVVDGVKDDIWENTELFVPRIFTKGDGVSATVRTMWDENYIYVWGEVKDSTPNDSNAQAWNQDSFEVFIDEDNANSPEYALNDAQYRVSYKGLITGGANADLDKFRAKAVIVDGGYNVEIAIPLKEVKGETGKIMGFDVQVNDDQGSGATDAQLRWSSPATFKAHADTRSFGDLLLVDSYTHLESNDATIIKISIDGKMLEGLDVPPFILEGRTLVPLRAIFEALGATVEWEDATQTVTGTKDGKVVTLQIDNKNAKVGDKDVTLDVPAMLKDSRTMVPARFIAESLGCTVDWVASRSLVLITTK